MSEEKPRKTLTVSLLSKKDERAGKPGQKGVNGAKSAGLNPQDAPRKRSGARARVVAQRQIASGERTPKYTPPPPREDRTFSGHAPGTGPKGDDKQADGRFERRSEDRANPHRPAAPRDLGRSFKAGGKPSLNDVFHCFATCPQGIEEALAQELHTIGLTDIEPTRAGCAFKADLAGMMRANLHSRTATRILLQLAQATIQNEDDIYALAKSVPWENWFGAEHSLRVDTSAVKSPIKSLNFCNLRVKDGICDRLREREGARPSIDTQRPDARVQLFLQQDMATLYLDTSGESLFKRGWRYDKGEAPLRENLAAALLILSGWDKTQPLYDPFCGSATILIEAVYMAQNVPPGIMRMFGFQRLRHHNTSLWNAIKDEAYAAIQTPLKAQIMGSDLDPKVLDAARQNMDRANLHPSSITLCAHNACAGKVVAPEGGMIITNPPYGERLSLGADGFWKDLGDRLKQDYQGWKVNIISNDLKLPGQLRLQASRRLPLYNGPLDCRFYEFDMVEGSFGSC